VSRAHTKNQNSALLDHFAVSPRRKSGNLGMFAAIRRASSLMSSLAADRLARLPQTRQ